MARIAEEEARGDTSRELLERVVADTLRRLGHDSAPPPTAAEWLGKWLEGERGAIKERTLEKYAAVIRDFLASLGSRSGGRLSAVAESDITRFRDQLLAGGRLPETGNYMVHTLLQRPFRVAVNSGVIQRNPIAMVRTLKGTRATKGTFSCEQISQLVTAATDRDGEWQGLILAGYYTGARLGDLVKLQWKSVDLEERTITFRQSKTGDEVKIPIHSDFEAWLLSRTQGVVGMVFPTLCDRKVGAISTSFTRLVRRAGIDAGTMRERHGEHGRSVASLSFHSLRHSFTTALTQAGIPAEIRMKLTGHSDARSHAIYSHHELETLRQAVSKLPKLG
jgi:integrase